MQVLLRTVFDTVATEQRPKDLNLMRFEDVQKGPLKSLNKRFCKAFLKRLFSIQASWKGST